MTKGKTKELKPEPCIILSPEDIEGLGYETKGLSQYDLEYIARKVGEGCMETWWTALENWCYTYCEDKKLSRKEGKDDN